MRKWVLFLRYRILGVFKGKIPLTMFLLLLIIQKVFAEMNWESLTIRVTSNNRAEVAKNLKSELYILQYDENKNIGDFLNVNLNRETLLLQLLNESPVINQRYLTDGSVEYVTEFLLTGKIIALVLPEIKPVKLVVPMLCPYCGQEWPKDRTVPSGLELIPKEIESSEYTGIIIDCRNLKFNPSLFPKIYNELSDEVYSINFADPRCVLDGGLCLFTTKDLYNNSRIGYNPLRIQAMGVTGDKLTNIKISSFDARRIHGSKKNLALLKECRVAIIFSP